MSRGCKRRRIRPKGLVNLKVLADGPRRLQVVAARNAGRGRTRIGPEGQREPAAVCAAIKVGQETIQPDQASQDGNSVAGKEEDPFDWRPTISYVADHPVPVAALGFCEAAECRPFWRDLCVADHAVSREAAVFYLEGADVFFVPVEATVPSFYLIQVQRLSFHILLIFELQKHSHWAFRRGVELSIYASTSLPKNLIAHIISRDGMVSRKRH